MESDNQLNCLFDYTKFHIGVYMTVTSILLAAEIKYDAPSLPGHIHATILTTLACFAIAGAAGGAIASNIPNFQTFKDYDAERLEIFWRPTLTYRQWATVEHGAFWLGSIVLMIGLLFFRN